MGGSLTVQSAGPGKGATFTLRLPLNQKDDTQNQASVPEQDRPLNQKTPASQPANPVIEAVAATNDRTPTDASRDALNPPEPAEIEEFVDMPEPGPQGPAIAPENVEALRELATDDNDNILTELIDTFLENSTRILAEARDALSRRSMDLLGQAAHTLRGSCSNFGAKPLEDLSAQLEALTRSPDSLDSPTAQTRAGKLLNAIRRELNRVAAALSGYRKDL
jgi:HPt (histidine-containing phosphotransfer) domain-containing protein